MNSQRLIQVLLAFSLATSFAQLNLFGRVCDTRSKFDGLKVVYPINGSIVDSATIEIALQLNIKSTNLVDTAVKESRFCLTVFSLPTRRQRWHHCGYEITNPLFLSLQTGWQEVEVSIKNIDTQIVECKSSTAIKVTRNGWPGCYHQNTPIPFKESSFAETATVVNPFVRNRPSIPDSKSEKSNDPSIQHSVVLDVFISVPFLLFDQERYLNVNIGDTILKMHSNYVHAFEWLKHQITVLVEDLDMKGLSFILNTHFVLIRNYDIPRNQSDENNNRFHEYGFHSWAEWIVDLFQQLSSVLIYDCPVGVDCTVPTAAALTRPEDTIYVFVSIDTYLTKHRALLDLFRMLERTTACLAVSNNPALIHSVSQKQFYQGNPSRRNYILLDYEPEDGTQWLLFDSDAAIHSWNLSKSLHLLQSTTMKSDRITLPFVATRAGCLQYLYSSIGESSTRNYHLSPISFVLEYVTRFPHVSLVFPMPNIVKKRIFQDNEVNATIRLL